MKYTITIGITDCTNYFNYHRWIKDAGDHIQIIKLSWKLNNLNDVEKCDGIIMSGGEDIHPRHYNKPEYYSLLDPDGINEQRDAFELKVLARVFSKKLPVIGICRGAQLTNVFLKGSLIPDIPTIGKKGHAKILGVDSEHHVQTVKDSFLEKITGTNNGIINSAHHQAVDVISPLLAPGSYAPDGTIESLEWKNPDKKQFLLLLQWHPERMANLSSPFSMNIKTTFLNEVNLDKKRKITFIFQIAGMTSSLKKKRPKA
jgi:putative glutamine amidotransferase